MQINRYQWLDAIRFIAASCVVITHLFEVFIVRIYGFDSSNQIGTNECMLGILAVITFFILSGYVISASIDKTIATNRFNFTDYIRKRFCRIYPVAWGATFFAIGIVAIMEYFNLPGLSDLGLKVPGDIVGEPNFLSINSLLYSIFLPPIGLHGGFFNVALWTLGYEVAFYLIYGLIVSSLQSFGAKNTFLYVLFSLFAAFTWWSLVVGASPDGLFNQINNFGKNFPCWNFFAFLTIWCSGVGWYYFEKHFPMVFLFKFTTIVIAILLFGLFSHKILHVPFIFNPYVGLSKYSDPAYNNWMLLDYSLVIGLIIFFLQKQTTPFLIRFLASLGRKYSYSLYATHFIIINFAFGIFAKNLNAFSTKHFAPLFIAIYLVANFFAYYFAKIFEDQKLWVWVVTYNILFKSRLAKDNI